MILESVEDDLRSNLLVEKWLGYLLQYMDHDALNKLMDYYQRIGWISESAKKKLISIAEGINSSRKGTWQVPSRVHITSLLFIFYLAHGEIPREIYGIKAYIDEFTANPEGMLSL